MARRAILVAVLIAGIAAALVGVGVGVRKTAYAPDWLRAPLKSPRESGDVVFLTLRSPTTTQSNPTANKQNVQTGFEHDLATDFAREIGAKPRFMVMASYPALLKALKENRGHIAAAGIAATPELRADFVFGSSYRAEQYQLIYRSRDTKPRTMKDATGKKILVIADTPAHDLLRELTGEFPGFGIEVLPHNTEQDQLLARLDRADANAEFAVMDAFAFQVAKRLHPELASAFNIGRERKVAWAFSSAADYELQQATLTFFDKARGNGTLARLMDRYYGHVNRIRPLDAETLIDKMQTMLPKLRKHFHDAQQATGIDWRLLAAVGYQESHWEPLATSPTGVRGVMMLTDDTADRMGVKNRLDARESILGGAKYLLTLRDTVPARIQEPDRTWLALAAYNQGYGHLEDARTLTARLKLNADSWLDVRKSYPKLQDPQHYETLKHGFARGDEAVQFVENIRNYVDMLNKLEMPLAVP